MGEKDLDQMSVDELEAEKQAMQGKLDKLKQDVLNADDSEKVELNREIRIDERYLKDIEKLLAEKKASEKQVVKETNSELFQLKGTWATSQIDSALSIAGIEGNIFDENKEPQYETVKKYLKHLIENSKDQASFVKLLSTEGGGCWSSCIQIALNQLGYYEKGKNNNIDGIIGKDTKNATLAFQKAYNEKHKGNPDIEKLATDSKPGYNTTKALLEELGNIQADKQDGETNKTPGDNGANSEQANNNIIEQSIEETDVENTDPQAKEKFSDDVYGYLLKEARNCLPVGYKCVGCDPYEASNNPYCKVHFYSQTAVTTLTEKFNLHDFINNNKFDSDKFTNIVTKKIQNLEIEHLNKTEDMQKARKFVAKILGKKYSINDLGLDKDTSIGTFFNQFSGSKVLIDSGPGYTYVDDNVLHCHFNKKGRDNTPRCDQEINKEDLKDENGEYSEDKFKEQLKKIITNIANEYYSA